MTPPWCRSDLIWKPFPCCKRFGIWKAEVEALSLALKVTIALFIAVLTHSLFCSWCDTGLFFFLWGKARLPPNDYWHFHVLTCEGGVYNVSQLMFQRLNGFLYIFGLQVFCWKSIQTFSHPCFYSDRFLSELRWILYWVCLSVAQFSHSEKRLTMMVEEC